MTNISPAVDLLLKYNPRFAYTDFSTIRMWLNDGCDMERDIIPALKGCMAKKADIKGIGYFTPAVHKARDIRLDTEQVLNTRKSVESDSDAIHIKAKMLAKTIRKFGKKNSEHERWLAGYESEYGRVEI